MLGASGQEELAKRLAELELSRELLNDLGDDQDWFDEDFGLSSRRKQQRQKEEAERLGAGLGMSGSTGPTMGEAVSSLDGEHVKIPPRPELPLPLPPKLPEQPAMVVPHTAVEVEKMVHAATQELWDSFDLGNKGTLTHGQLQKPQPSQEYLGNEDSSQEQEALSIRSYKKVKIRICKTAEKNKSRPDENVSFKTTPNENLRLSCSSITKPKEAVPLA